MRDHDPVAIEIPDGYRRLSVGELVKTGDFVLDCWDLRADGYDLHWHKTKNVDFKWSVKEQVRAIRKTGK